jgi:predicted O-linked N-acetylglucosamine transferase (SPINDLY family)
LLIDLKGLTQKNRLGIFSYKPAPIQATYLGFPGTTGADFIDYIITDKIVSPAIHKNFYSENFAYLPHCYQVNDNKQKISSNVYKRSDFNISKDAFVYGSFNQSFKLDVTTLDTWSNILLKSEKSIIVLIKRNDLSESNIKSYFSKKGINEERVIFVDRLPKDSHLARLKLVDLVLDTRIYNGHTTTSDALWTGVPVITCAGNHFASRVSESILRSAGMNRLIVNSLEEYEELAIKLSSDKILFQQIKDEMNKNVKSSPLFDTELFCGNLEKIYKQMIQIARNKEMSRQIDLADEKE